MWQVLPIGLAQITCQLIVGGVAAPVQQLILDYQLNVDTRQYRYGGDTRGGEDEGGWGSRRLDIDSPSSSSSLIAAASPLFPRRNVAGNYIWHRAGNSPFPLTPPVLLRLLCV